MPVKRRIPKIRRGFDDAMKEQLIHGHDFFGDAYGPNPDHEQMRTDYFEHRDEVFEENALWGRTKPPWAFIEFESEVTDNDEK